MKSELQNNVHAVRTDMGVTQEALAQEVGVSRQTILAIEKGNYEPSVLLALRIARFFRQPVEKIFHIHK